MTSDIVSLFTRDTRWSEKTTHHLHKLSGLICILFSGRNLLEITSYFFPFILFFPRSLEINGDFYV